MYVTDRFSTDLTNLTYGNLQLASWNAASGAIRVIGGMPHARLTARPGESPSAGGAAEKIRDKTRQAASRDDFSRSISSAARAATSASIRASSACCGPSPARIVAPATID